jgi:glycosyltransferase involved in cell wall biosynthesis
MFARPSRVLYVGRLSRAKNVGAILGAIARARAAGLELTGTIVGEGPEQAVLEARRAELGLTDHVRFTGGLSFEKVLEELEKADILALVSETEGWPKAIMEAMAFGLVCIGSDRGQIPRLLGDGRGIVVPPGDEKALADNLIRIAATPESFRPMIRTASAWAQQFSLDGLRESIRELLENRWGRRLDDVPTPERRAREAAVAAR